MKTFTFAAAVLAFGTTAVAEAPKLMCAEDCPAYVASPNKANLSLFDIQQMCAPEGDVCLVVDCSDKTE